MQFFPMDFEELNIDGFIDTGALSGAIPEAELRKIRFLVPQKNINDGPPPEFQLMVANGQKKHLLQQKKGNSESVTLPLKKNSQS